MKVVCKLDVYKLDGPKAMPYAEHSRLEIQSCSPQMEMVRITTPDGDCNVVRIEDLQLALAKICHTG